MRKKIYPAAALCALLLSAGCSGQQPASSDSAAPDSSGVTLHISAAASLTDALTEIGDAYQAQCSDTLEFSFAGSGTLQKQISEGAPCDLFISASKGYMDTVEEDGLLIADTRQNLLSNDLTLIASSEKADAVSMDSLTSPDVESIVLGEPDSVPAGRYAQQALEGAGIWEQLQDKIIYAKDVRQVQQYVDSGNADCGFVYSSDALLLESGVIICNVDGSLHDPIVYPAALLQSDNSEAAAAFYAYLSTDSAKKTFEKYGFQVIE